jgi:regulator of cell morphogenesis and NO signaling
MSNLDVNATVADWVKECPPTSRVFERFQIDYCCGGGNTLSQACADRQLDANEIVVELTHVVADPQHELDENWSEMCLTNLCDHIEQTHHAYLRDELPRLTDLVAKVVEAHSTNHPELCLLQQVFAGLKAELEPHMFKEEQILFPAVRRMESSASCPQFPFGSVANPIHMMEHEHDGAGNALARIRELTDNYQAPADACSTFRVMLDSLKQLEADTHQHIHKENNILFPKAQQLEAARSRA